MWNFASLSKTTTWHLLGDWRVYLQWGKHSQKDLLSWKMALHKANDKQYNYEFYCLGPKVGEQLQMEGQKLSWSKSVSLQWFQICLCMWVNNEKMKEQMYTGQTLAVKKDSHPVDKIGTLLEISSQILNGAILLAPFKSSLKSCNLCKDNRNPCVSSFSALRKAILWTIDGSHFEKECNHRHCPSCQHPLYSLQL